MHVLMLGNVLHIFVHMWDKIWKPKGVKKEPKMVTYISSKTGTDAFHNSRWLIVKGYWRGVLIGFLVEFDPKIWYIDSISVVHVGHGFQCHGK